MGVAGLEWAAGGRLQPDGKHCQSCENTSGPRPAVPISLLSRPSSSLPLFFLPRHADTF